MSTSVKNTPMTSAPYVYDSKGDIAWDKMWNAFCLLAKDGGPPHRGDRLNFKVDNTTTTENYIKAKTEITRAYKLLIPYKFRFNTQGHIEITLYNSNLANWFAEIIKSENVECIPSSQTITLPVNDDFAAAEIKNIVTVMAKAHHYWKNHRTVFAKMGILLFAKDWEAGIWE